jgi:SulP family sulfate permease
MFGFVNGLAIIIFFISAGSKMVNGESVWLSGNPLYIMIGLVLPTIAIVLLFQSFKSDSSPLVAINGIWISFQV